MADYGRQSPDLTSPQIPELEHIASMSLGNSPSPPPPEDGGVSSTNGGGPEPAPTSPGPVEPETPKEVQEVLASDVLIPKRRPISRKT
ncbi:hypothetical protein PC116_g29003 [Phytophthora cactorum]|nr:hypothetical protein PC116_g29003 [Phytophthora cactorum]